MHRPLALFAAVALLGCKDYEALCAAKDPSVTPASCWNAGWRTGFAEGEDDTYDFAFEEGYAVCLEDAGAF